MNSDSLTATIERRIAEAVRLDLLATAEDLFTHPPDNDVVWAHMATWIAVDMYFPELSYSFVTPDEAVLVLLLTREVIATERQRSTVTRKRKLS